jgi:hypothetical protein
MGFEGGFDEKIDVIDLIIHVLKDHEKKLDELISRLEEINIGETLSEPSKAPLPAQKLATTFEVRKWEDFRTRCEGSNLVAFDTSDTSFKVSAISGDTLYKYMENIPDLVVYYQEFEEKNKIDSIEISQTELLPIAIKGKLDCGLEFMKRESRFKQPDGNLAHRIFYYIDTGTAKSWLAYQLGIDENNILQGVLEI